MQFGPVDVGQAPRGRSTLVPEAQIVEQVLHLPERSLQPACPPRRVLTIEIELDLGGDRSRPPAQGVELVSLRPGQRLAVPVLFKRLEVLLEPAPSGGAGERLLVDGLPEGRSFTATTRAMVLTYTMLR